MAAFAKRRSRAPKATDQAVHEHPYQAIALGVGVGAILGYLLARRCSRNGDNA
jgi:ElaB/YqjD/DUF883 family membrane-anchored ribosome-binding protein